jgi:hypothetical protein
MKIIKYMWQSIYWQQEQHPSSEANTSSGSQEISHILWKPKVQARSQNSRQVSLA